jgi:hypothetical protein
MDDATLARVYGAAVAAAADRETAADATVRAFAAAGDTGADPERLAAAQLEANRRRLAEYEAIRESIPDDAPPGPRRALEMGIRVERAAIAFWEEQAG